MKVSPVPGRCEPCRKRLECDDCVAGSSWSILAPSGLWRGTYRKDDEAPRSTPDQAMVARRTKCWSASVSSSTLSCRWLGTSSSPRTWRVSVPSSAPGGPGPHGAVVLQSVPPSRRGLARVGPRPPAGDCRGSCCSAGYISGWGGASGGRRPGHHRRTRSLRRARTGGGASRGRASRACGRRWNPGRGPSQPNRR
jgi:hypothetical protein